MKATPAASKPFGILKRALLTSMAFWGRLVFPLIIFFFFCYAVDWLIFAGTEVKAERPFTHAPLKERLHLSQTSSTVDQLSSLSKRYCRLHMERVMSPTKARTYTDIYITSSKILNP